MSQHKALYNSASWKRKRLAQLQAEPLCRYCKAAGKITMATVADHIVPHRGNVELFYYGRLQSLCAQCHSGAKQELELTGKLRGCDTDGLPLDANHHWNRGGVG